MYPYVYFRSTEIKVRTVVITEVDLVLDSVVKEDCNDMVVVTRKIRVSLILFGIHVSGFGDLFCRFLL